MAPTNPLTENPYSTLGLLGSRGRQVDRVREYAEAGHGLHLTRQSFWKLAGTASTSSGVIYARTRSEAETLAALGEPGPDNEHAMRATVRSLLAAIDTLVMGAQVQRSYRFAPVAHTKGLHMNRLIYIIGAIVVIVAVLSFFGLR